MDNIVLFGDSLTQRGYQSSGWVGLLANEYIRRLDVFNRGFSGYNTDWALSILPQLLHSIPTTTTQTTTTTTTTTTTLTTTTRLFVLFFGANDAVLPGHPQHVPIDRFINNLKTMIHLIQVYCSQSSNTNTTTTTTNNNIVIITCPPIVQDDWGKHRKSSSRENDRSEIHSRIYSDATLQYAKSANIPYVDTTKIFQDYINSTNSHNTPIDTTQSSDNTTTTTTTINTTTINTTTINTTTTTVHMRDLFIDGLHLSTLGNHLLFDSLMTCIRSNYPHLTPDSLSLYFPHHSTLSTY